MYNFTYKYINTALLKNYEHINKYTDELFGRAVLIKSNSEINSVYTTLLIENSPNEHHKRTYFKQEY